VWPTDAMQQCATAWLETPDQYPKRAATGPAATPPKGCRLNRALKVAL
jgi:hypothetical protein